MDLADEIRRWADRPGRVGSVSDEDLMGAALAAEEYLRAKEAHSRQKNLRSGTRGKFGADQRKRKLAAEYGISVNILVKAIGIGIRIAEARLLPGQIADFGSIHIGLIAEVAGPPR